MGGDIDEEWEGLPEQDWVLVGTQDQLLSRALNRGYCATPPRWPVHFGLLNNDCHWVLDEVQLMGPGLWTSAQLDWMRTRRFGTIGPAKTTWMSATVGASFLDTRDRRDEEPPFEANRFEMKWDLPDSLDESAKQHVARLRDARRPITVVNPPGKSKKTPSRATWLAAQVAAAHEPGMMSLVVCNTVGFAQEVFTALVTGCPTILLTSRFRGSDRDAAEQQLSDFEHKRKTGVLAEGDPGLICVSTQVIEAGVDVSAHRLWSEAAPWPSIVQRLGRINRDGRDNDAETTVLAPERPQKGSDRIGPYAKDAVRRGHELVEALAPLSTVHPFHQAMALLRSEHGATIDEALAPDRTALPRAADVHGLFSTEPDVFGGFTDISEFVRSPDPNADVTVFWRTWDSKSPNDEPEGPPFDPHREGCAVSANRLSALLGETKGSRAWRWDYDRRHGDGAWVPVSATQVRPGMALMIRASQGGYAPRLGWTGRAADVVEDAPPPGNGRAWSDDPRTELSYWATLSTHLDDTKAQAERLVEALALSPAIAQAVVDAARFHDLGKAHPQWQSALPGRVNDDTLAKAPPVLAVTVQPEHRGDIMAHMETLLGGHADALEPLTPGEETLRWCLRQNLNRLQLQELRTLPGVRQASHAAFRPRLRHEVASALAMWAAREERGFSGLAVYLAACHHGKVRTVLRSRGGDDVCGVPRNSQAIEHNGSWTLAFEIAADGADGEWIDGGFRIDAPGWSGIVAELLGPPRPGESAHRGALGPDEPQGLGPFKLAYLEALVRIADWRASDAPSQAKHPGTPDVAG